MRGWWYGFHGFGGVFAVCLLRLRLLCLRVTGLIPDLGAQIDVKELIVVLLAALVQRIRLTDGLRLLCGDDLVAVVGCDLIVGLEEILFDF